MHGRVGVEAELVQQASCGVSCSDVSNAQSPLLRSDCLCRASWLCCTLQVGCLLRWAGPQYPCLASHTALAPLLPSQLPMCGLYADGEIGPEVHNALSGLRWAGTGATARSSNGGRAAAGTKLQGFTTIVTSFSK